MSGDGAGALDDIGPQCVVSCGMHARVVCQLRAGGVGALKLLPMMLLIKLKLPLTFICFCLAFFATLRSASRGAMGPPPPTVPHQTPQSISSIHPVCTKSPAHRFLGSCSVFGHYSKPKRGESVSGYGRPVYPYPRHSSGKLNEPVYAEKTFHRTSHTAHLKSHHESRTLSRKLAPGHPP